MSKLLALLSLLIVFAQAIKMETHDAHSHHEIQIFGKVKSPCPKGQTAYDNGVPVNPNGCGSG